MQVLLSANRQLAAAAQQSKILSELKPELPHTLRGQLLVNDL